MESKIHLSDLIRSDEVLVISATKDGRIVFQLVAAKSGTIWGVESWGSLTDPQQVVLEVRRLVLDKD